MKQYLTVGTDEIKSDLFVPIRDCNAHSEVKPSGGLWLTEFDSSIVNYNHWVDYLLRHPYVLFYKNKAKNPFRQPCCVVELKSEAKIYELRGSASYFYLLDKFSDGKGGFSYESLSKEFDGIYIDLGTFYDSSCRDVKDNYLKLGVNSLILFRLNAIDHYYSGVVDIEPFDYECMMGGDCIPYQIQWDSEKKYVDGSFIEDNQRDHLPRKR